MLHLGLLGFDIKHSKSQEIYEKILNKEINYTLFDTRIVALELKDYFNSVMGLSITSPHKQVYLKDIQYESEEIYSLAAINCIRKDGDLFIGTNTDYLALLEIVNRYLDYDIIILGNGVMSLVIQKILKNKRKEFAVITGLSLRNRVFIDFTDKKKQGSRQIIINCCSRSFNLNGKFDQNDLFYDLNYLKPSHSKLANIYGCSYIDGMELLKLQAQYALKFWNF